MRNYAIIKSGGKQYKVQEGSEILLDRLKKEKDSRVDFQEVLLIRTDEGTNVGTPYVDKASVSGIIKDELKEKKITVTKFKAKVHYRRKLGFRPSKSLVLIDTIKLPRGK
jgi:large subunit ribosomal protein L21